MLGVRQYANYGGGTRNRTGGKGFADPRLTTWLCRQTFNVLITYFKFFMVHS